MSVVAYTPSLSWSRQTAIPWMMAVFAFVVSLVFLPLYTGGDQLHYHRFYEAVADLGFVEGYLLYNAALSSREPVYYLLVYATSGILSKNLVMSLVNGLLGYALGRWLAINRVSPGLLPLVCFNFYLLVLFLAAERLKVGLLLLLLASLTTGMSRYAFIGAAVAAHVQTALLVVSRLAAQVASSISALLRGRIRVRILLAIVGAVLIGAVLFLLRDHVLTKLSIYQSRSGGLAHVLKPMILTVMTMFYAKGQRLEALAMQLPVVFAAFIVGGERVVIMSYILFMFYGLRYRRGINVGVVAVSGYFVVTGLHFLYKVASFGDGFVDDGADS